MKSKSTRKRCSVCHGKRNLESFYANGRGGLRPECKDCTTLKAEERVLARFGARLVSDTPTASGRLVKREAAQ